MGEFNPPTQIVDQKCSVQALNTENPTSTDLQPGLKADIGFVCCLFLFLTKLSHPSALTLVFNIKYKKGCVGSPVVSTGPEHVRLEIFSPQHRMMRANYSLGIYQCQHSTSF